MESIILIVEDHEAVRRALRHWLEVEFPKSFVVEATSGEEAIIIIRSQSPSVVVMDYKLPGMNGCEATQQIKATLPSIDVVMFSIREGEAYRDLALSAGAYEYVPKRTYQTGLLPILTELLDKSKQ